MAAQFDVIIVGGRCAGAPLATLFARAGMKVCVVDRAEFPSDTPSTHGVQPTGVKILDRLGVLDQVLDVAPAIEHGTVQLDDMGPRPRSGCRVAEPHSHRSMSPSAHIYPARP